MGTSGLGEGALDVKNEGEDMGSSLFTYTQVYDYSGLSTLR